MPVGIETYGAFGPQGIKLVKQIGKKNQDASKTYVDRLQFLHEINEKSFDLITSNT